MKLTFHGAAMEIGRSCIELETKKSTRILLDAGLKLTESLSEFPVGMQNLSEIDAVLISHAHLDHTGALPLFDHQGLYCPIYATSMTKKLTKVLLEDAFKIGRFKHEELGYFEEDIQKILNCVKRIRQKESGKVLDVNFTFYPAGHIPGSSTILVNADNKSLLYTGDINLQETQLMKEADTSFGEVDVLITESTYGDRDHPPRKKVEKEFLDKVAETVNNGGSVLIPCFAVGRAQEIMLLLSQLKLDAPVYLDGMAKEATDIILKEPQSIKDAKMLRKAYSKVRLVKGGKQRENIVKKQGVFITTSGMLTGGPVMDYLKHMYFDQKNSVLLTGYQGEHTNGRLLMDEKSVFIDGYKKKALCFVENFDFSAHSGLKETKSLIKKANPEHLVLLHGDPKAEDCLAEWARMLDYNVYVPKLMDKVKIER